MTKTELVEPRDLTPNERNLLLFLLGHISFDGAQDLAGQVERTKVAGGIVWCCVAGFIIWAIFRIARVYFDALGGAL